MELVHFGFLIADFGLKTLITKHEAFNPKRATRNTQRNHIP